MANNRWGAEVRVEGVKELRKALKTLGDDASKELKNEFAVIAQKVAANVAQRFPHKSGNAAGSVKGRGSTGGGQIVYGGVAAPYAPWLEWGGSVGRGHKRGKNQGAIRREWAGRPGGQGRYVRPTIKDMHEEITNDVEDAMERVAKRQSFEVRK